MVPRENKNNAYAKFEGTNEEYFGIFRNGLLGPVHTKTIVNANFFMRLGLPSTRRR